MKNKFKSVEIKIRWGDILEVYLDNCSTTKPRKEVIEEMVHTLREEYGNPSSLHRLGFNVEKKVEEVRGNIASFLGVNRDEIYFTSGGTESNNLAIQGMINKYNRLGKHIITTKIEHPSVLNVIKYYEQKGYEITYLKVDNNGIISLEELRKNIRDDTILVAIMQVNNEIGSIQPTWEIKRILKEKNSKALIHVDGIQAFGKIPLDINSWGIDTFSFSGHKVYGPKGIGGLYINRELKLNPIVFGGNQEKGLRSGTENVPAIVGMAKAIELAYENLEEKNEKLIRLRDSLIEKIRSKIGYTKLNGHPTKRLPNNVNISFNFIEGESLLLSLDMVGVSGSSGSACTSGTLDPSHVLLAIGLPHEIAHGSLRLSLGDFNTEEEIDYIVENLIIIVDRLRQMSPLYEEIKEGK